MVLSVFLLQLLTLIVYINIIGFQENGLTPLMLACRDNKFGIVEKLLELGSPVHELDKVRNDKYYCVIDRRVKSLLLLRMELLILPSTLA